MEYLKNKNASDVISAVALNPIEVFRFAIVAAGLTPPIEIIDDGAIHRFSADGKRTKKDGWYILYGDGVAAGAFGDWRSGLTNKWCYKADTAMTDFERKAHRDRIKVMQLQRKEETTQSQRHAAVFALQRWLAAEPCTQHDYLTLKGIKPHGVRIEGYSLLIPLRDTEGTIHSLQRITWQGVKLNMRSGRVKGCYFSIGKPVDLLIVCEGFATGASLHECTGHAVAVAFNADNLQPVAVALRAKYPDLKIIIAADDDHQTPGNPGVTKGNAAARAAGGGLAVPVFKESVA